MTAFGASTSIVKAVRTLNPATQDVFVLRRLILGTYLAAQFRFFFKLFNDKKAGGNEQDAIFAAWIAFYFYDKLQNLNLTHESSMQSTEMASANTTVQDALAKNVKKYNENTTRLSFLSTDMNEKKRKLTNEITRIGTEQAGSTYASKLKIVVITFSIIFAAAMLVVMMMPFETKQRMKIAGLIAVLVLVLAITMSVLARNIENFDSTPIGTASLSLDAGKRESYATLSDLLITEEMRNFYKHTMEITMALRNNRLYSELNYNSGKERNYFENSQYQLNKAVSDARNAHRQFDRETKVSTAVIRFFVQMIVIVAFILIGAMAVQDTAPGVRPFIFAIGGVLAVLSIIILFGELIGRTRMDADKMYWGTPNAVKQL